MHSSTITSMYDTIMSLPLFKGIGVEQLSQLLEKTSVEFLKFDDAETIAKAGQQVDAVDFILGGRVRLTFHLDNFNIGVDEILGTGSVLGALNLYGLETKYPAECVALGKVSIMRVTKKDYMNILLSDRIYILNFVNYLSAAAQKNPIFIKGSKAYSIGRTLQILAFSFVSRAADTVMVAAEDSELAKYCGVDEAEFEEWKATELAHNRIMVNQRGIFLKSPHLNR